MQRPNVLLVIADQWRAQSTGYAGNTQVQTPHLDAFATTAVDCHLAISGCPVCTPARASLLTALRPDRHGLFLNDAPLDPELPSLGKQFAAAGYETAWVGKWHVDGHGRSAPIPPERRHGFAYWKVLECTHQYHESRYYAGDELQPRIWPGYDAGAQTDDLIAWLRGRSCERPFCAVLAWGPPHSPYHTAPEPFRRLYDPQAITLPANVTPEQAEPTRRNLAGYYAHCTALDDCFGRLLACLDELQLSEDTIVLFTSDHGDFLGAHGLYDKQGPWDEALRVPFLIRGPGLPAGTRNDSIIDLIDVGPTLAGMTGLPQLPGRQGRDFSRHLVGGDAPADNAGLYACYHVFGNWPRMDVAALYQARVARGLRTPRHTYVIDRQGPWLLYDHAADPLQQRNLVDDPCHAGLRRQLHDRLHERLRQAGDAFLPGMEYVRRWGYVVQDSGTIRH